MRYLQILGLKTHVIGGGYTVEYNSLHYSSRCCLRFDPWAYSLMNFGETLEIIHSFTSTLCNPFLVARESRTGPDFDPKFSKASPVVLPVYLTIIANNLNFHTRAL